MASVLLITTVFCIIDFSLTQKANYFRGRGNEVLEHNAYGYFENIGIPEANRVYKEEEKPYLTPRIVGGEAADIKQFNYHAGLLISLRNFSGSGLCGGSLISANIVATAAHCWFDGLHQGTSMIVVLGSAKVFSGGTRVNTSKVIVHPAWDPVRASNDVAVVYLPNPVKLSKNIAPIALPQKSKIYECLVGKTVIATGFGKTGQNIPVTADQFLSTVNLTVISNEECSQTFPTVIHDGIICTSGNGTFGHVGICSGDSGGPLALFEKKKNVLVGIVSFGSSRGCDIPLPNGYARVSYYLDFLEKHIKANKLVQEVSEDPQ